MRRYAKVLLALIAAAVALALFISSPGAAAQRDELPSSGDEPAPVPLSPEEEAQIAAEVDLVELERALRKDLGDAFAGGTNSAESGPVIYVVDDGDGSVERARAMIATAGQQVRVEAVLATRDELREVKAAVLPVIEAAYEGQPWSVGYDAPSHSVFVAVPSGRLDDAVRADVVTAAGAKIESIDGLADRRAAIEESGRAASAIDGDGVVTVISTGSPVPASHTDWRETLYFRGGEFLSMRWTLDSNTSTRKTNRCTSGFLLGGYTSSTSFRMSTAGHCVAPYSWNLWRLRHQILDEHMATPFDYDGTNLIQSSSSVGTSLSRLTQYGGIYDTDIGFVSIPSSSTAHSYITIDKTYYRRVTAKDYENDLSVLAEYCAGGYGYYRNTGDEEYCDFINRWDITSGTHSADTWGRVVSGLQNIHCIPGRAWGGSSGTAVYRKLTSNRAAAAGSVSYNNTYQGQENTCFVTVNLIETGTGRPIELD